MMGEEPVDEGTGYPARCTTLCHSGNDGRSFGDGTLGCGVNTPIWSVTRKAPVLDWYKPDVAILAGGVMDFYMLSRFDRNPRRRMNIDDDIAATNHYFDSIDIVLPETYKKVFVEGNHDDRLRRFLWQRAPE